MLIDLQSSREFARLVVWSSGMTHPSQPRARLISLGGEIMNRPFAITLLALLLGLYAAVAGALVLVSLATRPVLPPVGFILLDLSIVAAASAAASSVWRVKRWANRALLILAALLAIVLWAHLLSPEAAPMTNTWHFGALGTFVLAGAALLGHRYLRKLTHISE